MKISVGGDHAGFPLKGKVVSVIKGLGHEVVDYGCFDETPIDFPDITQTVCESVLDGKADRALLVCGTGVGASIAANKIPGIRASVCHDIYSAHQCVEHDDVNVMCVGAQIVGHKIVEELIESFLNATFSTSEEFRRRVKKLSEMEVMYSQKLLTNQK
ncbi:ribose 5-phosphate isomerase B [Bacillus sp. N1-1]|jgi:ribose 5-phosphate isomerase B|uniref:ribose 5-phosphate isomerase B n=1 Tax=Bacillus sp. N1-1 TaxID=2682541 RepID=UPI001317FD35|nr:ribose 5-phosphate isomerase B [Bacillus sp. N1-1]QHA93084.1 ribose 5-phosphate isomerase B [Bacillus sp. N1-1]